MRIACLFIMAFFVCLYCNSVYSQSVGINATGTSPDGSAILDVNANNKGLLVPRVALTSNTDVATISSPATGLMIYNTATAGSGTNSVVPGFYYYNGSIWQKLVGSSPLIDNDQDTKVDVEESADEDQIRIDLAGTEYFVLNGPRINVLNSGSSTFLGENAGSAEDLSNNENVFIGASAGKNATTNYQNVAVGVGALEFITDGGGGRSQKFGSTAIGYQALQRLTGGKQNTAIGYRAMSTNELSHENTAVGAGSLTNLNGGGGNTAVGFLALENTNDGLYNTAIGNFAMRLFAGGNYNIGIGYKALENGNSFSRDNIAIGRDAIINLTDGVDNIGIGHSSLENATSAQLNVAIGYQSMFLTTTGTSNVSIGPNSLYNNITGGNNVAIGSGAGHTETGSNKLFIHSGINSDSTTALIYGKFNSSILRFNGDVGVGLEPQGKLHVDGSFIQDVDTISPNNTTPDVSGANLFITSANGGATAITDLTNPQPGQVITIIGGSNTNPSTIADGGNFDLSAAWTANLNDVLVLLVIADNNYIELSRVNN